MPPGSPVGHFYLSPGGALFFIRVRKDAKSRIFLRIWSAVRHLRLHRHAVIAGSAVLYYSKA